MVSPSRKGKEDLNIPAQTQGVQAMVPTRVNIQQHVTEQASFPKNHNPVNSDNQVPTGLPPFDKEKLLAMQARVLQGRLQSKTPTSGNMEMTKTEAATGPVKRQVAEAWNNEKHKRNYEAPKPQIEEQHEISKTSEKCQCCEHYGRRCLQEDSLMTAEARQRYHSDINGKLSMHVPNQEGVNQAEDRNPTINLEDWTITFKEFQPKRSKQPKKQISKASQEKLELPQPLADSRTQSSFNQPQPKAAQPPHDNSIKKNHDVQRVMVEQKNSPDGCLAISCEQGDISQQCCNRSKLGHHTRRCPAKRDVDNTQWSCYNCGKGGHYAHSCPTKHKKTRSHDLGLYCLKCGEDGHLASWCEKKENNN